MSEWAGGRAGERASADSHVLHHLRDLARIRDRMRMLLLLLGAPSGTMLVTRKLPYFNSVLGQHVISLANWRCASVWKLDLTNEIGPSKLGSRYFVE